jgi:hypothetical protein
MRLLTSLVLVAIASGLAHADRDLEPRVSPQTAQWISIATTAAGLGASGYMWLRADGLEEGHGRAELQLASLGTGLLTMGIGPASGLIVAGEYRRGATGALTRPLLIGGGTVVVGMGAFVMMWGCFETSDCPGAKVAGGIMAGIGGAAAVGGIGWAIYDIWDTPRVLERRRRQAPVLAPIVGGDRVGLALTFAN